MTDAERPGRSSAQQNAQDRPVRLNRSPHPYQLSPTHEQVILNARDRAYLPSPSPTPPNGSDSEADTGRKSHSLPKDSPPESGTEHEDEQTYAVRALPAPPLKLRKGLRHLNESDLGGQVTPLLTPSQLNEDHKSLSEGYFDPGKATRASSRKEKEQKAAQEKFYFRRRAELLRRISEFLSLCAIAYVVASATNTLPHVLALKNVLLSHCIIFASLLLLYPVRLFLIPFLSWSEFKLGSVQLPAAFDPAPLLYPTFLPILVALSIASRYPVAILLNIILGVSAMPVQLVPRFDLNTSFNVIHWMLSTVPLLLAKPEKASLSPENISSNLIDPEDLVILFPLHQAILRPLSFLTTTSLLPSELQLASIALINLLILSTTPQAKILSIILWVGGLGTFMACGKVLRWNVALERIPNWRFRRAGRVVASAATFVSALSEGLEPEKNERSSPFGEFSWKENGHGDSKMSSDVVSNGRTRDSLHIRPSRTPGSGRKKIAANFTNFSVPNSPISSGIAVEDSPLIDSPISTRGAEEEIPLIDRLTRQKRRFSQHAQAFLSLTPNQAFIRKAVYTVYTYCVLLLVILGPVRILIGKTALNDHEPFGWAIGYLFSDIPGLGKLVDTLHLNSWIFLVSKQYTYSDLASVGLVDYYRNMLGLPTTRLVLFSYWAGVIVLGLMIVLYGLRPSVEVDTRRKVFHGMMVLMLLPTTYVDPCFLALGLTLVFVVFLLLDLFRASQLKPLAKPLATFLTPYVDGRDLRGPVVVSHIFLLIGCAIPLWLSLASTKRAETRENDPWKGWELETRDLSMVAGVICVGMGDAAASLVGRRYGRRKWPWAGGKSLEGSAAFAGAVTLGLVFGKAWLLGGGWKQSHDVSNSDTWLKICGKAGLAAAGASFTEAVLTGANDNVVVPVVLWLLVRGLGI